MKVMFYISSAVVGGAETLTSYQIKWHRKLFPEDELHVAVAAKPSGNFYCELAKHAKLIHTPDSDSLALELEYIRPDIFQTYHSMVAYKAIAKLRTRPIIVEQVHGCFKFENCSVDIPKIFTDHVVAVSEKAKEFFLSHVPECKDRTSIILNGVDPTVFNNSKRLPTTDKVRIGTISRISEDDKKITKVIDAFNSVAHKSVEFFIIGSGYSEQYCKQYARTKSAEFQRKLHWIPYQTDPQNWFKKLDIFVSRCESEGFGNSIAEALLSECAVVAHYCGGITDHLPVRLFHCAYSQTEFEYELLKAIDNDGERRARAQAARTYALENFTSERMVRGYRELYTKLLNETIPRKPVKAPIIGIATSAFTGVCESLKRHVDIMIPVPLGQGLVPHVTEVARYAPRAVLLAGSFPDTESFIFHVNTKWKVPFYYTVHNSFSFCEFNPSIDGAFMAKQIDLAKTGKVQALLCTKQGMDETLRKLGISAYYLPNKISMNDYSFNKENTLPGINIGIFSEGVPWKNQLAQIIAASTIPGATIHLNLVGPHEQLLSRLGCKYVVHGHLDRFHMLDLMRKMTMISAVSVTETFCYVVMEAAFFGVPTLISPMSPVYSNSEILRQECTATCIDDTVHIAERISNIIGKRDMLSKESLRLFADYYKQNEKSTQILEDIWQKSNM